MKRNRADLVHAYQAIALSGKGYRLTVRPDDANEIARALRFYWANQHNHQKVGHTPKED